MGLKVGLVSLGCSKNQVDAEHMLAALRADGFSICGDVNRCDAVIVNTCGFIEDAKRESIDNILSIAQNKGKRLRVLAVTGCLAERYQQEMQTEFPEADVILGLGSMADIAGSLRRAFAGERVVSFGDKTELSLEGERLLANDPWFAYLKVAEGCDNRCAYCAIPDIRGAFRSRLLEDVLREAKTLAARGVKEINVVAQDTTRYGEDLYKKTMLPELLQNLTRIEPLHWVRLLYCYPDRVTDELIDVIAKEDKIVKYIDLPLQHIDDGVLSRMNRRGNAAHIKSLLKKLRDKIPGVTIRTTFITGMPGETEEAFSDLCNFVQEQAFDRLGCFAYSPEEGTPAAQMEDRVPSETARRRAEHIMQLQMDIAEGLANSMTGKTLTVLCEGFDEEAECFFGRGEADAPDIDTKVFFTAHVEVKPGSFAQVYITGSDGYDLVGEMVEEK